jgi:hypothetical protein
MPNRLPLLCPWRQKEQAASQAESYSRQALREQMGLHMNVISFSFQPSLILKSDLLHGKELPESGSEKNALYVFRSIRYLSMLQ